MTTITETHQPTPGAFNALIDRLWDGKVSEDNFVQQACNMGVSAARIEWEIETLKNVDGITQALTGEQA